MWEWFYETCHAPGATKHIPHIDIECTEYTTTKAQRVPSKWEQDKSEWRLEYVRQTELGLYKRTTRPIVIVETEGSLQSKQARKTRFEAVTCGLRATTGARNSQCISDPRLEIL